MSLNAPAWLTRLQSLLSSFIVRLDIAEMDPIPGKPHDDAGFIRSGRNLKPLLHALSKRRLKPFMLPPVQNRNGHIIERNNEILRLPKSSRVSVL